MDEDSEKGRLPLQSPGDLATIRTALALERTLLAEMRTALTLTGFGFTLAKFVHDLIEKGVLHGIQASYPRQLGFTLMGLGVITLVGGAFEYVRLGRKLNIAVTRSVSLLVTVVLVILSTLLIVHLLTDLKAQ